MTDVRASPPRLITRWATQAGREPAALSRDRARLDTRGFADLLAEAAHLAGLVGFQEAQRLIGGDWRAVLAADPAMVLALLATIDVEGRSEGLQALLDRARATATTGEAERLLGRLLDGLVRFAAELDEWLAPAAAGAALEGHAAQRLIEASIERVLAPQLRSLLAEVAAAEAAGLLRDVLPRRHRLRDQWRLALIEAEVAAVRDELERVWIDRLLDRTAEVAETFVIELREIGAHSEAALHASLGSGRHSPQVALVMAFARVFRHAQERLNDVPQKVVRFYQRKVLRDARRGASPDRLFLTIAPRPHSRPRIEAGTLFAAGRDATDAPVSFAADAPLEVTGARLAALTLWSQARAQDGAVERVEARLFAPGPDGEVGDAGAGIAADVPRTAVGPAAVFAAPALPAGGGRRRIALALACNALPEAVSAVVLAACVRISVSTAEGWLELDADAAPRWQVEAGTIKVAFELAPDKVPLAPCPAGTPDAPDGIALRLALDQEPVAGAIDPWALLGGVTLSGARLDVAVKDAGDLAVSNSSGPASAAGAAPFGTPPYPGGWLRVDHPVLRRPLDRLLLRLDWAALPPGPDGFAGYYREYEVDLARRLRDPPLFTNLSFMVTMAAPVAGWDRARLRPLFAPADPAAVPPAAAPPPDIFDPDERFDAPPPAPAAAGPLSPTSWFAAAASDAPGGPVPDHLLVTLATPPEGFGDAVYPANVAHATALLARMEAPRRRRSLLRRIWAAIKAMLKEIGASLMTIIKAPAALLTKLDAINQGYNQAPPAEPEEEVLELEDSLDASAIVPNPPFHPMLSAIRLDYAVSVPGDALALFHARPLDTLEPVSELAGARLFAPLPDRPTIDCALAGARPGDRLSLLVRLGPPRGPDNEIAAAPDYFYHAADGWRALPAAALLADGTAGLSATGLLRIAVPADAALIPDEDDRDEDKRALWLRIVLAADAAVPPILAVTPDALSATRMLGEGAATFAPVPAGTVAGLPGVARVAQPLDSAGGRPAEDAAMQRRRVAERVRHRGRGLLGWDLERLVLAEFPGIDRVRVLAAGDPAAGPQAGEVTVIVVPAQGGADPPDPGRPRALPRLRDSIKLQLEGTASPFARVQVVDPVYAPLDVTAQVVVESDCGDALRAALASFLSPWAEPGLDLDDAADEEAIRAAIAAFLLAQPGVAGLDLLEVALGGPARSNGWRVPVAGTIELTAIAIERAALPW
ncbi:MAG: hypothetical protein QOH47_541 [Sphingomonadales bacterium]|nr:hypothetical protein [Sphingomonadales bacterium]